LLSSGFLDDEKPLGHTLLFHMVDKAHPALAPQAFREALERLGASLSVTVGGEYSEICLSVTSERLKDALQLVTPVFSNYTLLPSELQLQVSLLQRHLAMALARPAHRVNYELRARKYGARFPGAAVPDISDYDRFSVSELEGMWRSIYPARLKAVCLTGNVPGNFSLEWLPILPEKDYIRPKLSLEDFHPTPHESVLSIQNLKQVSLRWWCILPLENDPEQRARLRVTTTLLGGFFGSRLMRLIREKEGLTYGIHAALSPHTGMQFLDIATEVDASRWQEAKKRVEVVLKEMAEQPPSDEELQEVKNYMAGRLISAYDGVFPQSERWLARQKSGWTADQEKGYMKAIENVTPHDVATTASRWLNPEAFYFLRSEPS
jgi:predicted Zn-dependent peptidase